MAAKKNPAAMNLIQDLLKANPAISYQDVVAKAAEKKLTVHPVMYGRAKTLLGIIKAAPRGQGKAAKASKAAKAAKPGKKGKVGRPAKVAVAAAEAAPAAAPAKRGRGRPRKHALPASAGAGVALSGIVDAVRSAEQARARYVAAIEKIQAIVKAALGS